MRIRPAIVRLVSASSTAAITGSSAVRECGRRFASGAGFSIRGVFEPASLQKSEQDFRYFALQFACLHPQPLGVVNRFKEQDHRRKIGVARGAVFIFTPREFKEFRYTIARVAGACHIRLHRVYFQGKVPTLSRAIPFESIVPGGNLRTGVFYLRVRSARVSLGHPAQY